MGLDEVQDTTFAPFLPNPGLPLNCSSHFNFTRVLDLRVGTSEKLFPEGRTGCRTLDLQAEAWTRDSAQSLKLISLRKGDWVCPQMEQGCGRLCPGWRQGGVWCPGRVCEK